MLQWEGISVLAKVLLSGEERACSAPGREAIIGDSPAIKAVLRQVEMVAPTTATVLLQGETGDSSE
jgi:transcriptional regulator with GAF, ATPase, and Fis domain